MIHLNYLMVGLLTIAGMGLLFWTAGWLFINYPFPTFTVGLILMVGAWAYCIGRTILDGD